MFQSVHKLLVSAGLLLSFVAWDVSHLRVEERGSVSHQTSSVDAFPPENQFEFEIKNESPVCDALRAYPKPPDRLSFKTQSLAQICKPFVSRTRASLDRCGAKGLDPYASLSTWPSRVELASKKGNLYLDEKLKPQLDILRIRIEEMRLRATNFCCATDSACRAGMAQVRFEICEPKADPNEPDPCVFGGSFHMPGASYETIFSTVAKAKGKGVADELRALAKKNMRSPSSQESKYPLGRITLSSYVSLKTGIDGIEPVIVHELGHACSLVKMRNAALDSSTDAATDKALRAMKWLDGAKKRCDPGFELPEASFDFWESVGESRELAQCLNDIATYNQKQLVDKPCNGLCTGHYLEESVGVAFSLLVGDVGPGANSVFPNTCDHIRDAQHPLVSDVAECLTQHSPRFREKLAKAYSCTGIK